MSTQDKISSERGKWLMLQQKSLQQGGNQGNLWLDRKDQERWHVRSPWSKNGKWWQLKGHANCRMSWRDWLISVCHTVLFWNMNHTNYCSVFESSLSEWSVIIKLFGNFVGYHHKLMKSIFKPCMHCMGSKYEENLLNQWGSRICVVSHQQLAYHILHQ